MAERKRGPFVLLCGDDPGKPPALIGRCVHCGGEMYLGLPASAANVVRVTKVFADMHKDCHRAPASLPLL